jgi:hypothetical protein
MCNVILSLADRRGLSHFLRSNHNTAVEIANRSRRTSRSATADRMHSVEHTYTAAQRHDHLEDVEHKRVIDNFVVRHQISKLTK